MEQNHKIITYGEGQATDTTYTSLIGRFYEDQFRHSQDPRAPYFMMMSRNGRVAMGIGGVFKLIGTYDFDGSIDGTDFDPYKIAIPIDPTAKTAFQASPYSSQLFFTVFGNDARFGDYKLYIEAKFNGGSKGNAFVLKNAYATVGDWTLGYTKSTFEDAKAQPATIDTEGPNSEVSYTTVLLRYMHHFKGGFSVAASVEAPKTKVPDGTVYSSTRDCVPSGAAFIQYAWDKSQHIRLSGVVRGLRYRDMITESNHYRTGWGLHLSTVFRPVDPVTIYAAGITGHGIGSMINDLECGENDLIALADEPGKMYAPQSFGWYAGVQYNFSPSVYSTAIVSQERILPRYASVYGPNDYKYGLYGTFNTFWEITPRCHVGAEFNIGKRMNMGGDSRLAYRVAALAEYSF